MKRHPKIEEALNKLQIGRKFYIDWYEDIITEVDTKNFSSNGYEQISLCLSGENDSFLIEIEVDEKGNLNTFTYSDAGKEEIAVFFDKL